jgi:hypothetical protein
MESYGFHAVTLVSSRALLNASRFVGRNLAPLVKKFFSAEWSAERRKLVVHIDNPPAHNSRMTQSSYGQNPLKRLQHPSYSPDISPSDFSLFEKGKSMLIKYEIPDEIDLLERATEISNGVSDAELQGLFRSWIERVERVVDTGGDSLTS